MCILILILTVIIIIIIIIVTTTTTTTTTTISSHELVGLHHTKEYDWLVGANMVFLRSGEVMQRLEDARGLLMQRAAGEC